MPIAIVGGGPSGLIAAIAASENHDNVVLFNKNPQPGKKIAAIPREDFFFSEKLSARKMAARFGDKAVFVEPIFSVFNYNDLIKLFKKINLEIESDTFGHFKANGVAGDELCRVLLAEATRRGVTYRKSSRVTDIVANDGNLTGVTVNGSLFPADKIILATGSFSSPKFGSTRDGYEISQKLGHTVSDLKPALVDLITEEKYGKTLSGDNIEDVRISIFYDHKLAYSEIDSIKFTDAGISGEFVLNHSAEIIEKLNDSQVEIRLDFMPDQPRETFESWFIKECIGRKHILVGQLLNRYFDDNAIKVISLESRIKLDKSVAHITNLERKSLIHAIKDFRLTIKSHKPFNNTRGVLGGVSVDDIDPKTMQSKKLNNLFFAGDIIDVLGPYGGYNMQFAFSSGYVAGKSAAQAGKGHYDLFEQN